MSKQCKAKRYRDQFTCVACNYTWNTNESKPECRPKYYGEQKIKEIKGVLK